VVLTSNKDIYTCGHNSAGQLGVGDEQSRTTFTHVSSLAGSNISRVFAGGSHTWALIDSDQPMVINYEAPSPIMDEPVLPKES
jgi:alpha-tubulin suppressor-like RCC1 family protein